MTTTYPTKVFELVLRTTETPTGNSAARRLAMVLKYIGRTGGFKCVSVKELKEVSE